MDHRSNRLSAAGASSSSTTAPPLPRRRWSHLSPVSDAAGPSHSAHPGRYESTSLDEATRAHRTTALRQLNGTPKPLSSWKNRQTQPSSSGRSSTLASQPVLVRSYSGGPDDPPETTSKMPLRRSFPFVGGGSSILTGRSSSRRSGPELPSEQDFSIDHILRAIEPNIRSTLDTIGEICGRSKLSLANEYGSHIAPLGEIRAPPGGLGPVEEASSDHERQGTDNVVIYDDETSVADGREYISFPLYGYVEHVRQTGGTVHNAGYQSMLAFSGGDAASVQAQPDTPRSVAFNQTVDPSSSLAPPPTREFASKPRSSGRALLGKKIPSRADDHAQGMSTSAVVSEVLLDAQAGGRPDAAAALPASRLPLPSRADNLSYDGTQNIWTTCRADSSVLTDVQALFGWLRHATQDGDTRAEETAEMRLRAMLEREARSAGPVA
ncbi:hypothetical protein HFD88_007034 [Aspergillus terreus]|nr:hypothetical protein HFD88_007034 [Aspergillus terreus]